MGEWPRAGPSAAAALLALLCAAGGAWQRWGAPPPGFQLTSHGPADVPLTAFRPLRPEGPDRPSTVRGNRSRSGTTRRAARYHWFWSHSPRKTPEPPSPIVRRFFLEPGIPKLKAVLERISIPTVFHRPNISLEKKPEYSCQVLQDFAPIEPSAPTTHLRATVLTHPCLPNAALEYPAQRSTLTQFMAPPDVRPQLRSGITVWGALEGGEQFPFFTGAAVRYVADIAHETRTRFFWQRHARRRHSDLRTGDLRKAANRSLVYWNLNPGDPDLQTLRHALLHGDLTAHIFLIAHNQDRLAVPDWLLAHPLILKVFAVHLNATQRHPKLVVLPEGVHPMQDCRLICQTRRRAAKVDIKSLVYSRFQVTNVERSDVLRAVEASGLGSKNRTLQSAQKGGFYAEAVECRFILAPRGNGLDTFRLWEALYLGRIPVLRDLHHPDLLRDLPVVFVDEWADLNASFLEHQLQTLGRLTFDLNRLWAPWWVLHIVRHVLDVP